MTADIELLLPERFDCTNGNTPWCQGCYTMTPDEYGDYVQWEDYERITAAQAAEIERLQTKLAEYQVAESVAFSKQRATEARAERLAEELRAAVADMREWGEPAKGAHVERVQRHLENALRNYDQEEK